MFFILTILLLILETPFELSALMVSGFLVFQLLLVKDIHLFCLQQPFPHQIQLTLVDEIQVVPLTA
jgi:hypothetical protein